MSDVTEAGTSSSHSIEQRDLTGKVCGDFRILRKLGQGGMGQVYLAEQISLKRKVALKFLKAELSANKTSLERFKREAEAVARATHANIVQIYSLGEADGLHFMALEYIEGRNLREFIERKGPPDVRLGLRIMAQIASALQQSSELGIVHRDIKPENVLINRKGEVKVTDFGLSRHFKQDSNLTESRLAMGTPLYMSPEQVEGKPVDHRSDIYSFGVTCYHLFAGQPPFKGGTPFEVALQHVNKEPPALSDVRPDLPADLCGLVHKLMMKRPEARYQTGREIVRDIAKLRDAFAVGGGNPSTGMLIGLSTAAVPHVATTDGLDALAAALSASNERRTSRRPWLFAGMIVAFLASGLIAGWLWTPPPIVAVPMPERPPEGKAGEPPMAVKELFSAEDREKDLARKVHEHLKAPLERGLGLEPIMELGVMYLREDKLDEADAYFKDLKAPERRVAQYKTIGALGQAMVLAFRDQPYASNKWFVEALDEVNRLENRPIGPIGPIPGKGFSDPKGVKPPSPKLSPYGDFFRQNVAWREQMARAIHRNFINAPDSFPTNTRLHDFRKAPMDLQKAPAGTP
jgi:tRNA A-37 threonylcarbamoyl transferase component Bud32